MTDPILTPWACPRDGKSVVDQITEAVSRLVTIWPDKGMVRPEIHACEWGFFKQGRWLEGNGHLVFSLGSWGGLNIQLVPRNDEVLEHLLEDIRIVESD